jgi:hypothetical protein
MRVQNKSIQPTRMNEPWKEKNPKRWWANGIRLLGRILGSFSRVCCRDIEHFNYPNFCLPMARALRVVTPILFENKKALGCNGKKMLYWGFKTHGEMIQ